MALTELVKEILYINQVIDSVGMVVEKHITVFCDNMQEICLSKNCEGKRTKYLYVQYHFIREKVEEVFSWYVSYIFQKIYLTISQKNIGNLPFIKARTYLQ